MSLRGRRDSDDGDDRQKSAFKRYKKDKEPLPPPSPEIKNIGPSRCEICNKSDVQRKIVLPPHDHNYHRTCINDVIYRTRGTIFDMLLGRFGKRRSKRSRKSRKSRMSRRSRRSRKLQ